MVGLVVAHQVFILLMAQTQEEWQLLVKDTLAALALEVAQLSTVVEVVAVLGKQVEAHLKVDTAVTVFNLPSTEPRHIVLAAAVAQDTAQQVTEH